MHHEVTYSVRIAIQDCGQELTAFGGGGGCERVSAVLYGELLKKRR